MYTSVAEFFFGGVVDGILYGSMFSESKMKWKTKPVEGPISCSAERFNSPNSEGILRKRNIWQLGL